jgi:hypothetical protein
MILFFASEEGRGSLPTGEERLLLSMLAAVVEYLGGDNNKLPSPNSIRYNSAWSYTANEELASALQKNLKNINPALAEALRDLLTVEWKHDYGESWWESGIGREMMFWQISLGQTFYLTYPKVLRILRYISENTDSDVEHCRQIGALMSKYVIKYSGRNNS